MDEIIRDAISKGLIEIVRKSRQSWADRIADCIEHDEKRHYIAGISLALISAVEYTPDVWSWLDWMKGNLN